MRLFIVNPPRSTTRQRWRLIDRWNRVTSREITKAHTDAMIFGAGYVMISADSIKAITFTALPTELSEPKRLVVGLGGGI